MKHYPPEFKADVVALYESRPEATIRSVAAVPGGNPETLWNGVRAAGASRPRGRLAEVPAEPPMPLEAENAALRKKVAIWRRSTRSCARRLAAATPERLLETATAWTHTEDGGGQDPGLLADFLERLGELARDAGPRRRLYCGMSL
ncbi:transposase [Streptomyces sp. 142MFCol3.1]|uniref:transposase n=1 Tax=Streptomyces sp. 142MFCol3.1 TaxID=1172179 RepID=UPI001F38C140|nr:transposase [Streptomyces sp. 142MFCol3.1]